MKNQNKIEYFKKNELYSVSGSLSIPELDYSESKLGHPGW